MFEPRGVVDRLAAAIADGEPIHWERAEELASPREQHVLTQLRAIAGLRTSGDVSHARKPASLTVPDVLWGAILGLAAVQVLTALVAVLVLGNAQAFRYFWADVAISAAFALAAVFLAWGGKKDGRARHLGAAYLLFAAAGAHTLLGMSGAERGWPVIVGVLYGLSPEAFQPLAQWRFVAEFPRTVRFSKFDRYYPAMAAMVAIAGVFLFVNNWMISVFPEASARRLGAWPAVCQRSSPAFWYVSWALSVPALTASAWRVLSAEASERRRVLWFVAAVIGGLTPIIVATALLGVSGTFRGMMSGSAWFRPVVDATVVAGMLSIPFTTAYAVIAHRTLTVRLVVRQTIRYALARKVLAALVALPLAVPIWEAFRHHDLRIDELSAAPHVRVALVALVVGVALLGLRERVIAWFDRQLGYAHVDLSRELATATDAVARGRTVREVAFELRRQVERVLSVTDVAVLWRHESGAFAAVAGPAGGLPANSALPALLSETAAAVLSRDGQLFGLLPYDDRLWLSEGSLEMLARIPFPDDDTAGLVAVRGRRYGFGWDADAVTFVTALSSTAGVALRRVRGETEGDPSSLWGADLDLGALECVRCGIVGNEDSCGCRTERRPARLPAVLGGKIDVIKRIGRGGMGVVYLGRDRRLNRDVALKTLPHASGADVAAMLLEARTMACVEHQNLALIYDIEMWRGTPVLIVEYLANGTLHDELATDGRLDTVRALEMGVALAHGLEALHRRDILHRDIKPSNIGFTRAGAPKLLDFGIARLMDRAEGVSDVELAGTWLYLSPELLGGARPHMRDDLWALSLVVLQALTGVHPFPGERAVDIQRRIAGRSRTVLPDPTLEQWFFSRLLHADYSRRPGTAAGVGMELAAQLEQRRAC